MFTPGGGGQQHICRLGGFGHKDVLHHHEVERVKPFAHQAQIGFGLERVFPHDVIGFDLALQREVRHFGDPHADLVIHQGGIDSPRPGEFLAYLRVRHVLIAGELVGDDPHVARALHVILSAHRTNTAVLAPEVAGEQRQGRKPFHHVHRLPELGDAHPPHHGSGRRGGVDAHRITDLPGADAGNLLDVFRGVPADRFAQHVQPLGVAGHVVGVIEVFVQQGVDEGVHQRHVAAVVDLQMPVGNARGFDFARIADDHPRAVLFRFDHPAGDDRV